MHARAAHRRTVAFAIGLAVLVAQPARAAWRAPVDGAAVARAFDLGSNPFEGGRHRGVDFASQVGAVVRAPCAGRVAVAGRVGSSGGVVTVLCGHWRVSHMPLATIAVRRGVDVRRGTTLGTLAASRAHTGLHLGVRRDGNRFGYVDPLRFLAGDRAPPPIAGHRPPPIRTAPRPPRLGPAPRPVAPSPHPVRRSPRLGPAPAAAGSNQDRAPGLAPWPAWAGLALVLAGVGLRWRRAARPGRAPVAAPEAARR
jgi:Peptidase family M23